MVNLFGLSHSTTLILSMIKKNSLFIIALILLLFFSEPAYAQDNVALPIYIVQSGENLTQIAQKFNVSVQDLINANNIVDANLISEGTELFIPGIEGVSGILVAQPVSFGETLDSILLKNRLSEDTFKKLNPITSPAEMYVGSNLVLIQQEEGPNLSQIVIQNDDTLLSTAVRSNKNPWEIKKFNRVQQFPLLPGDALFYRGDNEVSSESIFSENISSIEISPLPFVQGHTNVLYIYASAPVNLQGSFGEEQLIFFYDDAGGFYYAIHGVHALEQPGLVPLTVSGNFEDGNQFTAEQMVLLTAGGYRQEEITVEQTTIEQEIVQNENAQVQQIVKPITPEKYWQGPFRFPVDGSLSDETIGFTSVFGSRRSYNNGQFQGFHGGLDFEVRLMSLNIYAPAPGVVVYTGPMNIRGNTIFIDHGRGVYSGYAHLNQFFVNVGDVVQTGQIIGEIGKTGRVTGPHLHWDIWINGNQVDPLDWVNNQYP